MYIYFYGLAVKTGSIALQKFFFFFFFLRKKVCYLGSEYFFPDSSQKTNGTPWPSFFDILSKKFAHFFVKSNELCQLLQYVTDLDDFFRTSSHKLGLTQF